jgi:hypothetical protein
LATASSGLADTGGETWLDRVLQELVTMSTDGGYRSLLMGHRKLVMYVAIWRPSATSVLPQILVAVNELGLR